MLESRHTQMKWSGPQHQHDREGMFWDYQMIPKNAGMNLFDTTPVLSKKQYSYKLDIQTLLSLADCTSPL